MVFLEKQTLVWKLGFLLLLCVGLTGVVSVAVAQFWWLLSGIAIAYLFSRGLKKTSTGFGRAGAATLGSLFTLGVVVFLFGFVMPPAIDSGYELARHLKNVLIASDSVKVSLVSYVPAEYQSKVYEMLAEVNLGGISGAAIGSAAAYLGVFAHNAVLMFAIPLMVFYFLYDRSAYEAASKLLGGKEQNTAIVNALSVFSTRMKAYMKGKVVEGLVVAVVSWLLFFFIADTKYTVLLTIVTFLSVFIPFVGAALSVLLVGFLLFAEFGVSAWAIGCVIGYVVIHILDGNVLVPVIFSEALDVPPSVIILAVILAGSMFGLVGVFLAIPVVSTYLELAGGVIAQQEKETLSHVA